MTTKAGPSLDAWASNDPSWAEGHGSTWNVRVTDLSAATLEVEGEGRTGLGPAPGDLDCGNSGTSMRLLAGLLSAAPHRSVLTGDESLRSRPMERVAEPLRAMGATIRTREGTAPMTIEGGELHSVDHRLAVPSAQIKGAVLLAGLDADGTTTIEEPAPTRDHTERAIRALGGPVKVEGSMISVSRFQHEGFTGIVPGDPSSAAFLVAAAASTGGELTIEGVGLNPSRLHYLDVLARMGVRTEQRIDREQMGEPVGDLWVGPCDGLVGTAIDEDEIPLVIDEIPIIAAVATSASGDTTFAGAGELRVKESDRLAGMADGIVALGGGASVQGDDLVVAGGGLEGGRAQAGGDHRMAMAFAVAGTAARAPVEVDGIEVVDVSFPGFVETLTRLGASFEVTA